MRRELCTAGLPVASIGVVAVPQGTRNTVPSAVCEAGDGIVYLFENETGETQSTIGLVFAGDVSPSPS